MHCISKQKKNHENTVNILQGMYDKTFNSILSMEGLQNTFSHN